MEVERPASERRKAEREQYKRELLEKVDEEKAKFTEEIRQSDEERERLLGSLGAGTFDFEKGQPKE